MFPALAEFAHRALTDPGVFVSRSGGSSSGAAFSRLTLVACKMLSGMRGARSDIGFCRQWEVVGDEKRSASGFG